MKAAGKKFEIVFASSDRDQTAFDEYYAEIPWLPPTFAEVMTGNLISNDGNTVAYSSLAGKTIGIYFSAHWCPPCRGFTPELVKTYNKLKEAGKPFEIIFASSDRDEASFKEYFETMPWLALPFADREKKEQLSKLFGVNGIPSFHIIEHDGTVINNNGRSAVGGDLEGAEFPWHPKPVNDLSAGPDGINDTPSIVVLMEKVAAEKQTATTDALTVVASRVLDEAKAKKEDDPFYFYTGVSAGGITDRVRDLCKAGDAGETPQLFLLDIPDNGGYYKAEAGSAIDEATLDAFCRHTRLAPWHVNN